MIRRLPLAADRRKSRDPQPTIRQSLRNPVEEERNDNRIQMVGGHQENMAHRIN